MVQTTVMTESIYIIGGGTVFHVRPHLALAAMAYGTAARRLAHHVNHAGRVYHADHTGSFHGAVHLYLTKMAGDVHEVTYPPTDGTAMKPRPRLETNDDVANLVEKIVADPTARILFLPVALCDFRGQVNEGPAHPFDLGVAGSGKELPRLSSAQQYTMDLVAAPKILQMVRATRKDLFLVAFKTTAGASREAQFEAGLRLLKTASCNLVVANDIRTRHNMIVTPEQSWYAPSDGDRDAVLRAVVDMAIHRSQGTFTRSTVVPGDPVFWNSNHVPSSLRTVVDHCIRRGAYRAFLGKTVGHFAFKVDDKTFVTSRRGADFNDMAKAGMVKVELDGVDRVIAHGAKPSVGGQSQRIIFHDHPDVDCIVHFHCPLREGAHVPTRPQWLYECGSHECGENTSDGLAPFELGGYKHNVSKLVGRGAPVYAVMLDRHGPNIVFHRDVNPQDVIDFIEQNFDLTKQTSDMP